MNKTVEDFGDQWTTYRDNAGYYGSLELFEDIVGPHAPDFKDKRVADIGAGTGRISLMLVEEGVGEVVAIEPSSAFSVLQENTLNKPIKCIQGPGEIVVDHKPFDIVVSIGVIHHIPNPDPVIQAAYQSLHDGGHIVIWLYGREGNEMYLFLFSKLRMLTSKMPDSVLKILCHFLNFLLSVYIKLCKVLPLPMHKYIKEVVGKFDRKKRFLVIFDQLNPEYAKYYSNQEAIELLENSGFKDVTAYHRHGYSWTVVGKK